MDAPVIKDCSAVKDSLRVKDRLAVAAAAAILIADHAMGYAQARKKAALQCFGSRIPRDVSPSNEEIDEALLEHLNLFDSDQHQARIQAMRAACLSLMQRLETFNPYVTGAAWKGIVSEHVHAHLQLFFDDSKAISIELINMGLAWEATEVAHFAGLGDVEALALQWQDQPFQLSLYSSADFRGALKPSASGRIDRGNRDQLLALMQGKIE